MCTEQLSHIPPVEGHNMAAGFVCSEDLCLSVERACTQADTKPSKTQTAANANSQGSCILLQRFASSL